MKSRSSRSRCSRNPSGAGEADPYGRVPYGNGSLHREGRQKSLREGWNLTKLLTGSLPEGLVLTGGSLTGRLGPYGKPLYGGTEAEEREAPYEELTLREGPLRGWALTGRSSVPYGDASLHREGRRRGLGRLLWSLRLRNPPYGEGRRWRNGKPFARSLREEPRESLRRTTKRLTGRLGPYGKPLKGLTGRGPYGKGRCLRENLYGGPFTQKDDEKAYGKASSYGVDLYGGALTGRPTKEILLLLPFIEKAYVRTGRPLWDGVAGRPLRGDPYMEILRDFTEKPPTGKPAGRPLRETPAFHLRKDRKDGGGVGDPYGKAPT